jgi:glycogen debranching enzyme
MLGLREAGARYQDRADAVERAIVHLCWDEASGTFFDRALPGHLPLTVNTISSLFPLILERLPRDKLDRLVEEHLLNEDRFWLPCPLPSVSRREAQFNPCGRWLLWRGPTWMNTNWFLAQGLRKHGYSDVAAELASRSVELVERSGFREYYNPLTGKGMGQRDFGWSTLVTDMMQQVK